MKLLTWFCETRESAEFVDEGQFLVVVRFEFPELPVEAFGKPLLFVELK